MVSVVAGSWQLPLCRETKSDAIGKKNGSPAGCSISLAVGHHAPLRGVLVLGIGVCACIVLCLLFLSGRSVGSWACESWRHCFVLEQDGLFILRLMEVMVLAQCSCRLLSTGSVASAYTGKFRQRT